MANREGEPIPRGTTAERDFGQDIVAMARVLKERGKTEWQGLGRDVAFDLIDNDTELYALVELDTRHVQTSYLFSGKLRTTGKCYVLHSSIETNQQATIIDLNPQLSELFELIDAGELPSTALHGSRQDVQQLHLQLSVGYQELE